jgi:hypothetical protein
VFAPLQDLMNALRVTLRERRFLVALQKLREAEDCIERRPELVTHRREEIALRAAGGLGGCARLAELFGEADIVG